MTSLRLARIPQLVAVVIGFLLTLTLASATPVKFDIPAQPAPAALQAFIKQSGLQVVYDADALRTVSTNAVQGEFEPLAALQQLLAGTGFTAREQGPSYFVIESATQKPGSIEGSVQSESGRPVAGARVSLTGSSQTAVTDKRGRFTFEEVPAGPRALVITAEGMQNTKVTDVNVTAGHRLTLSTIAIPVAGVGAVQLENYVVSAKKNDGVVELDPYEVSALRAKPFTARNVDLPRTADDAQPYYILNADAIHRSAAIDISQFLKTRLSMNTVMRSNVQSTPGFRGNNSNINLRGLGEDKTLILVNGRRVPSISIAPIGEAAVPDINGIPLAAVERIEVLPTSASGIYGGGAIGGVVNIVLKAEFAGGEVKTTYENTWKTDAPIRTIAATYGGTFEGGKTRLLVAAQWSDAKSLEFRDRRALYDRNFAMILANQPSLTSFFYDVFPPDGVLPNIVVGDGSGALRLKNGTVLNSARTYIPAGITPTTSASILNSALVANSGSWNLQLPDTNQGLTGLRKQLSSAPETWGANFSLRRQMTPKLEAYVEGSYSDNKAESLYNPYDFPFYVSGASPASPFANDVFISFPHNIEVPTESQSTSRSVTAGAIVHLPAKWIALLDATWTESQYRRRQYVYDGTMLDQEIQSGALNPFVDTSADPLNLNPYLYPLSYSTNSRMNSYSIRGSGPLPEILARQARLTLGLDQVETRVPSFVTDSPTVTVAESFRTTYFPRESTTRSAYGELDIPIIDDGPALLRHASMQFAGRAETSTVNAGTVSVRRSGRDGSLSYNGPTLNGEPFTAKDRYKPHNFTSGIKYQPSQSLTLRTSLATAFIPPRPEQFIKNPVPNPGTIQITDPKTSSVYRVQTVGGGNPSLKPQNSTSLNTGIVWAPVTGVVKGLRANVEFYRIEQEDAIGGLSAQNIISNENSYADRITRTSAGTITLVDVSLLNLYKRKTEGWDLSLSYGWETRSGSWALYWGHTLISELETQFALTSPAYDAAGHHPEDGGVPKSKGNVALHWKSGPWAVGWSAYGIGKYFQYGVAGGPVSRQQFGGAELDTYIVAQGAREIDAQYYHDVFVEYAFGVSSRQQIQRGSHRLSDLVNGMTISVGIKNVLNEAPPFDAYYGSNSYLSPYGDTRLRSFVVSVKAEF